VDVFVVYFVCPSQAFGIAISGFSKYFKTLVDKDIVYQKIGEPISENPYCNG